MPYLAYRKRGAVRHRMTPHLGQVNTWPNKGIVYLTVTLTDTAGLPLQNAKFYFDVSPDPSLHPEIATDPNWSAHYSQTTDIKGQAEIQVWVPDTSVTSYLSPLVSVTPLFDSAATPINRAIIWQQPTKFSQLHDASLSLKNVPGGGLVSPNALPSGQPQGAPPAQGSTPSGSPSTPASGIPWEYVLVAGLAFALGLYLMPMIMKGDRHG